MKCLVFIVVLCSIAVIPMVDGRLIGRHKKLKDHKTGDDFLSSRQPDANSAKSIERPSQTNKLDTLSDITNNADVAVGGVGVIGSAVAGVVSMFSQRDGVQPDVAYNEQAEVSPNSELPDAIQKGIRNTNSATASTKTNHFIILSVISLLIAYGYT